VTLYNLIYACFPSSVRKMFVFNYLLRPSSLNGILVFLTSLYSLPVHYLAILFLYRFLRLYFLLLPTLLLYQRHLHQTSMDDFFVLSLRFIAYDYLLHFVMLSLHVLRYKHLEFFSSSSHHF